MNEPGYDLAAPKRMVSLSLNADLLDKALRQGGDLSERIERLLAEELAAAVKMDGLDKAIAASNAFIEKYGCFADDHTDF